MLYLLFVIPTMLLAIVAALIGGLLGLAIAYARVHAPRSKRMGTKEELLLSRVPPILAIYLGVLLNLGA